jgi:hypothetical protein
VTFVAAICINIAAIKLISTCILRRYIGGARMPLPNGAWRRLVLIVFHP